MTKRTSTTAKVTKATAQLIDGYTARTGNGVIVRHKGEEYGVIGVRHSTDANGNTVCYFACDEKVLLVVSPTDLREVPKLIPAKDCTILKTTITTLQNWNDRYHAAYELIASDTNGTVGKPSGRYVVSRDGGIVTDSLKSLTPAKVARFIDDTLTAETVGLWESNNTYYLDANASFEDLDTAERFGRDNEQLAIFDSRHGKVISI
jgi:hypothetical protein